jgi:hypothetical protein
MNQNPLLLPLRLARRDMEGNLKKVRASMEEY